MRFTSYAQNFEDVMLWRALKHIKNGFYIDIGGRYPDLDSVTLAFYENNWKQNRPWVLVVEATLPNVSGRKLL